MIVVQLYVLPELSDPLALPSCLFFFNDSAPTEIYTLSLHDALPIYHAVLADRARERWQPAERCSSHHRRDERDRSEEHTSELQSREKLVCRLLLEKKNNF